MHDGHEANLEVSCSMHELPGSSVALSYAEAWRFLVCKLRCIEFVLDR